MKCEYHKNQLARLNKKDLLNLKITSNTDNTNYLSLDLNCIKELETFLKAVKKERLKHVKMWFKTFKCEGESVAIAWQHAVQRSYEGGHITASEANFLEAGGL